MKIHIIYSIIIHIYTIKGVLFMKRLLGLLIICFVILNFTSVFAEESVIELPHVSIVINGEKRVFTDVPISINDRTLLPLRQCLTYLGVPNDDEHIIWNQSDQSVTVKGDDIEIYLKLYDNKAMVNGNPITLSTASTAYKQRTYIPARFIAESLNKRVDWDSEYESVYIADMQVYDSVKTVLDKVFEETKNVKDLSYTINYDLDIKWEGNIPEEITETEEKHAGTDIVKADLKNDVTHIMVGDQGFQNPSFPVLKEAYCTNELFYENIDDEWSISELAEGNKFSASTSGNKAVPRESQPILNSLFDIINENRYSVLKINHTLSNENVTVLEGNMVFLRAFYKTLSIISTSELGNQTFGFLFLGAMLPQTENTNTIKTEIYINNETNRLDKLIFYPNFNLEMVLEGDQPTHISVNGNITYNYSDYNQDINIIVPHRAMKFAPDNVSY